MALLVVAAFVCLLATCFLMARRLGNLETELTSLRALVGSVPIPPRLHNRTVSPSRIGRMYAEVEPGLASGLMKLPGAIGLVATALFTILSAGASLVQIQADETRVEVAHELAALRASLDSMKAGTVSGDSVRLPALPIASRMAAASAPRGAQVGGRISSPPTKTIVPAPIPPATALPTAP